MVILLKRITQKFASIFNNIINCLGNVVYFLERDSKALYSALHFIIKKLMLRGRLGKHLFGIANSNPINQLSTIAVKTLNQVPKRVLFSVQ